MSLWAIQNCAVMSWRAGGWNFSKNSIVSCMEVLLPSLTVTVIVCNCFHSDTCEKIGGTAKQDISL